MDKKVGVLGGGRNGRMLAEAANRLKFRFVALLDSCNCPAMQINANNDRVNGSFKDPKAIRELAAKCDMLTAETERVETAALENICKATTKKFDAQSALETLRDIQDKFAQNLHLSSRSMPVSQADLIQSSNVEDVQKLCEVLGYPMLKSRTEGYYGRGNCPIRNASEIPFPLKEMKDGNLYAEEWVHLVAELAVMVVKVYEEI